MVFLEKIKRYIPISIKRKINLLFTFSKNNKWEQLISKNKINIFIFLSGFYQNLGDMAITYAQSKFLKEIYPEATIILIPSLETYTATKMIQKLISKDDIITITGGGNMSDLYQSLEDARLHVLKSFPNNKIICFPQTISYSNTKKGVKRKKISCSVYNQHQNLFLFAREKESYEKMKVFFPNINVECCPDIVLYLNKLLPKMERNFITCCLRNDKEKNISDTFKEKILDYLRKKSLNIKCIDTVNVDIKDCVPERYEEALEQFWLIIKESRLVITDRLHCMIFCIITGTPCIVLDNSNHKIKGVYETWLQNISYVKLISENNFKDIIQKVDELLNLSNIDEIPNFIKQFENLKKICKGDFIKNLKDE